MVDATELGQRVRRARVHRAWSQADLARRSGVSRQAVGALEAGRHLPRVDAAVALASALGTTVEALLSDRSPVVTEVLDRQLREGQPVRATRVVDRFIAVAVPTVTDGEIWRAPDAVVRAGHLDVHPDSVTDGFLVVGCDPALGILADLAPPHGRDRLLAASATSAAARDALIDGRTHAAVVHGRVDDALASAPDVHRLPLARWRTGLAVPAAERARIDAALSGEGEVIQREPGAAAQAALVRALPPGVTLPGPQAAGHLDAARRAAVTGVPAVTIEPAALALGLTFRSLEVHVVEVHVADHATDHPGARVLGELLGSADLRRRLGALPAYEPGGPA